MTSDLVDQIRFGRLVFHSAHASEAPPLGSSVVAQNVGGDPEEPRPGVWVPGVITGPTAEGRDEGLGDQVVYYRVVRLPSEVAVDDADIAIEYCREGLGIVE